MELFGFACVVAYCVVATLVGVKLFRLSLRTGEAPERYLGLALLSGGAVGYPVTIAAGLVGDEASVWAIRFAVAGTLSLHVSSLANVFVWRHVFHPEGRRALWWAGVWSLVLFAAAIDQAARAATQHDPASPLPWTLGSELGAAFAQVLPHVLIAFSALRYAARLDKQVRFGLADPLVANRIRLWGWVGVIVVFQYGVTIVASAMYGVAGDEVQGTTVLIGAMGFVVAVLLTLAFFPSATYRGWIERRSARAVAEGA